MAYTFYAVLIAGPDERHLRHIRVEGPIQTELTELFDRLQAEFYPDGTEYVPFDPFYKLDDDEMFELTPYKTPDFLAPIAGSAEIADALSTKDLEETDLRSIVGVNKTGRTISKVLFLYIDNRHVLRRSALNLLLDHGTFRRMDDTGLSIPNNLVAEIADSSLLFRKFNSLSRILDLSEFVQEATEPQMTEFFGNPKFLADDVAAILSVADSAIRRKISTIMANRILDKCSVATIVKVGEKYGIDVDHVGSGSRSRIILKPERWYMKRIMRLLAEDYLDSALSTNQFLVNSKRQLGNEKAG